MAGGITAAVIGGAAVLGGAYMSAQGAQNAASTQANAAAQQQANLLAAGQQASQQFTPYANYGTTALNTLTANNPYFNQQFSNADLNANLAPNYAFMLGQGQQANLMANNATGGAISGNTLKSLQDYTQNYASNAYQNAFTNFQNQRNAIAGIDLANANLGLAGATGSANAQLGTATNIAQIGLGAANAQAASQIAQGNIYGGAANSLGSLGYGYAQQQGIQNAIGQQPWSAAGYGPNAYQNAANPALQEGSSSFVGPSSSLANFAA
jgi:hypothetical protein